MKYYLFIFLSLVFVSGCFTMINHPDVEIYYERENGEEYLSEDYDVYVDEDCSTCHEDFIAQKHFSPLLPAHDLSSNWNDLPWWLDTKYLMFFNERNDSSSSVNSGYQHVSTQRRNNQPPAQQGGFISGSSGGGTSSGSGSQNVSSSTTTNENTNTRSRSSVSNQGSGSSSKSSASTSKRKFRKRK